MLQLRVKLCYVVLAAARGWLVLQNGGCSLGPDAITPHCMHRRGLSYQTITLSRTSLAPIGQESMLVLPQQHARHSRVPVLHSAHHALRLAGCFPWQAGGPDRRSAARALSAEVQLHRIAGLPAPAMAAQNIDCTTYTWMEQFTRFGIRSEERRRCLIAWFLTLFGKHRPARSVSLIH